MSTDENLYPHAPDVSERESSDGGFSRGWGMHFQPIEKRIVDMHGHIQFDSFNDAAGLIARHMELVKALNVTHCIACTPIMSRSCHIDELQWFSIPCVLGVDALRPYFDIAKNAGNLSLMLFMYHANPDMELLRFGAALGACALKLHNAPIIVNAADPEIWLSDEWEAAFDEIERLSLRVLWHVTQRLTDSPYTGGGRETYWKNGWKKGVRFTNEDLLRIFLKVVERHPGIPFIAAHQLHLGWERLGTLFDRHPNLYSDTSVGCTVNEGDRMYEDDIRQIREIFIRHCDRMLFGTDYFITDATSGGSYILDEEKKTIIKSHIRFIRQLRLPDDALQKVFHGNAERLLRLDIG